MFSNPKNLSFQQAKDNIQAVFPFVDFINFSKDMNLCNYLDILTNSIPRPILQNHKNIIINMKMIADTQEYKIQKNMIDQQHENELHDLEKLSIDMYNQRSTTILNFNKKISVQTSVDMISDESEEAWWKLEQKPNSQDELEKQCFSFLD